MKYKFGSDPELFAVSNKVVNGLEYIVPPIALITDGNLPYFTRDDGKKVILSDNSFEVIEDGAAFEINVAPSKSAEVFYDNYQKAVSSLEELLAKYELNLSKNIAGFFDTHSFWDIRDDRFRECVIFGCDPDHSLYRDLNTEENGTKPLHPATNEIVNVETYPYRFGGGHIHFEFPNHTRDLLDIANYGIAYMLDFTLQTFIVSLHKNYDSDIKLEKLRLEHYGKPGTFRMQKHGFEYRPPSNWWLNNGSNIVKSVLEMSSMLRDFILKNKESGIHDFVGGFFSRRVELYNALTSFDIEHCEKLHKESLTWLSR